VRDVAVPFYLPFKTTNSTNFPDTFSAEFAQMGRDAAQLHKSPATKILEIRMLFAQLGFAQLGPTNPPHPPR
jgi:hypothetical protein